MADTQTIVRSRTKSFRDIHVAIVTKNTETEYATDTPTKLARAITGKISDKFESEKIYSDDSVEDTNMTYTGTEVEFEVNALAPQDVQVRVHEIQVGASVAGDELLPVRGYAPALAGIGHCRLVLEGCGIIKEHQVIGPCKDVERVPEDDGSLDEVLAGEVHTGKRIPCRKVHGAEGTLAPLARGFIQRVAVEKQSLGIRSDVVRVFPHHFHLVFLDLGGPAGDRHQEDKEYERKLSHSRKVNKFTTFFVPLQPEGGTICRAVIPDLIRNLGEESPHRIGRLAVESTEGSNLFRP